MGMLDKIRGALFGVAIGDALGATTEFMTKEAIQQEYGKVTEIIGGGHWQLEPGDVTDDTEMTIALIKGIMTNSMNPIEEIGRQFLHWKKCNPVDIGITIRTVMEHYQDNWFDAARATHEHLDGLSAGNGSLMRCLPIALAYSDGKKVEELSVLQSKMTHYDELAAEACVIYNKIASRVLGGEGLRESILEEIKDTRYDSLYEAEPDCPPDGFVVHTMQWVLYWLLSSETFEDVVVGATNMGNDSDTIAAIAGGLKGLEVGYRNLPGKFKDHILCRNSLDAYSYILFHIRDQDTLELKESMGTIIRDLVNDVTHLNELVDQGSTLQEQEPFLKTIKKNIYVSRLAFNEADPDYDGKLFTWRMAENRYNRTQRLCDFGAPKIIILHEVGWLTTMIDHLEKWHKGIEPQFTEEETEELEMEKLMVF